MASYVDQPIKFAPYVETVPVEDMVKVGMYKQQKYDEGVQKIQSWIDEVGSLPVIRPVDKSYLQDKINVLGENLNKLSGADFSKQQLVNSVGSLTAAIAKDPNIIAGVQSAANTKNEMDFMEEARKKGELTPENRQHFLKRYEAYYNSTDLGRTFNDKYVPYVDVDKYLREEFDKIKPGGMSFDQIYVTDEKGNPKKDASGNYIFSPVMTRVETSGRTKQLVQTVLSQILNTPKIKQQLDITGEYVNAGYTPEMLSQQIIKQQTKTIEALNNISLELQLKKSAVAITEEQKEEYDRQIEMIKEKKENLSSYYNKLNTAAFENPDYVRSELYKQGAVDNYTAMFTDYGEKRSFLSNPGWQAAFEQQKFADERERWQKDFNADQFWKQAEYEQRDRLALLNASVKKLSGQKSQYGTGGMGPGGDSPTLGDQFSNLDVLYLQEKNYEEAASKYSRSADEFIWQAVFSENDALKNVNDANLKKMVNDGLPREVAIKRMIDEAAKQNNESPEAFRARWTVKAENIFTKTPKKTLEKNPQLLDSYTLFNKNRKLFKTEQATKDFIEKKVSEKYGEELTKETFLRDVKPAIIQIGDQQIEMTKEDIYDLALYLRGNASAISFLNDKEAARTAQAAEARLNSRGKSQLMSMLLHTKFGSDQGGAITTLVRTMSGISPYDSAFTEVKKVFERIVDPKNDEAIKMKQKVLQDFYNIKPNLNIPLTTGDASVDKKTASLLKGWAGAYNETQAQNVSPDFSKFVAALNDEKASYYGQVILDANFNPKVEIVALDKNGKRAGGMTIQPDEAASLNIDIDSLYESKEIASLRAMLNVGNNSTSRGPANKLSTYESGDYYFNQDDFPQLANSKYKAKANIVYANGKYWPYLYISDGENPPTVRNLPGSPDLTQAYNAITLTNPALAQSILNNK
jgi:hypothetical protein